MTTVAISTSGGDAPGLNAAIRAATLAGHVRGWRMVGIRDGLRGITHSDTYGEQGGLIDLTPNVVGDIASRGGTILGAANDGVPTEEHISRLSSQLENAGIDALISIGGDGTQHIAHAVSLHGVHVVGVPKTIDNDLPGTTRTIGFDTAVARITDSVGALRDTADSHGRIMFVEVMGRDVGWLALYGGLAGGADIIVLPEFTYTHTDIVDSINARLDAGVRSVLVVVAEGVAYHDGSTISQQRAGGGYSHGGIARAIAHDIGETHRERHVRATSLGHIQRGGQPTAGDRILATTLASAAVSCIEREHTGILVGWSDSGVTYTPLEEIAGKIRRVEADNPVLASAQESGIYIPC